MLTHPAICPPQTPQEPMPEYANRVLGYALTFGAEPLTLAQLETADAQAARIVAALPATLNPDDARLDTRLHQLRLDLAAQMAHRRRQRAQEARLLAALQDPPERENTSEGPSDAPETAESRAVRLLRAALILLMTPDASQDDAGGGRPAPLRPPPPTRPPGSTTADAPVNIAF